MGVVTIARIRHEPRTVVRYLPLILVPLLLCASTFPGHYRVPWAYWLLAMAAATLFTAGGRWPVPASLGISLLAGPMFAMPAWGLSGLVPYLGAAALVSAVARTRRILPIAIVSAGWAIAVLLGRWHLHDPSWPRLGTVVEVGTYVGLPVLLGLYLRGQRDVAEALRLRAADAEARRADAELRTRTLERAAMARELHDLVAHHMASIVLRIGVVRHVVDTDPRVSEVLDDVRDTAADALADIRRLLDALRDPSLGKVALIEPAAMDAEIAAAVQRVRAAGFTVVSALVTGGAGESHDEALGMDPPDTGTIRAPDHRGRADESAAERFDAAGLDAIGSSAGKSADTRLAMEQWDTGTIRAHSSSPEREGRADESAAEQFDAVQLDAIGRLTLMRLVQESLTNVMKHADPATPVEVELTRSDGGVALRVRNGVRAANGWVRLECNRIRAQVTGVHGGVDRVPVGHGIVGMRERVELVGGRLTVGATAREWRVDAWVPGVTAASQHRDVGAHGGSSPGEGPRAIAASAVGAAGPDRDMPSDARTGPARGEPTTPGRTAR